MPVLLDLWPRLTLPSVVTAVAGHLRRPWARPAFPALLTAFYRWAPQDNHTAWAIGNALATAAGKQHLPELLAIARNPGYGATRAVIVDCLWRFRKDNRVAEVLVRLLDDADVCLPAMSALRRTLGNNAVLPYLRRTRDHHPDPKIRQHAGKQVRRAESSTR